VKNVITRLNSDIEALQASLMSLTIDLPKPCDRLTGLSDAGLAARDAVLYRAAALAWHTEVLVSGCGDFCNAVESDLALALSLGDAPNPVWDAQRTFSFLLDDVVFNAMSLLDYASALAAEVCGVDVTRRRTWKRIAEMSRSAVDGKESPIPRQVAELVLAKDSAWVSGLDKFRGIVIHREVRIGSAGYGIDLEPMKGIATFYLAPELVTSIAAVLPGGDVEIRDGAVAIVRATMQTATELVEALGAAYCPRPPQEGI